MNRKKLYILLLPLSAIYFLVATLRNLLYDRGFFSIYKASIPVISVGNLTVGGSGKTPLCAYLAKVLKEQGFDPVILSRGYGGNQRGPLKIENNHTSTEVGDEPLMYSRTFNLPVVISRARAEGARLIQEQHLGDLIILDDGFQHRSLHRDLDIVCVRATSRQDIADFLSGTMLPAGDFREPLRAGIRRADMLVISSRRSGPSAILSVQDQSAITTFGKPVFNSELSRIMILDYKHKPTLKPPQRVFLASAIAEPLGFRTTIELLGFEVAEHLEFGDHFQIQLADLESLRDGEKLPVICTGKDFVRFSGAVPEWLYECRIESKIVEENLFLPTILDRIRANV